MSTQSELRRPRLAILGGGPGGYEAASVAAALGAEVTLVERAGMGGSAVLTDVVPSKTLIATADIMNRLGDANRMGVHFQHDAPSDAPQEDLAQEVANADMAEVNGRLLELAKEQSRDIKSALERAGVRIVHGEGVLVDPHHIRVSEPEKSGAEATDPITEQADVAATGEESGEVIEADVILLAVGARPRELPSAMPDGERIFNWTQIYQMTEVPEHLIVVGSGVTGAEFASAYNGLGAKVTLISSRDRVLPGEDADAAKVLEDVFEKRGMSVLAQSRAESVERTEDGVRVTLSDGRTVDGSHCLVAVGSIPNTAGIGLEEAGVKLTDSGHIRVDGVSRTSVPNIYAAGDCTGVLALASVAAMQGRIAIAHLMGDSVKPLKLFQVASNIFTSPEIATVGVTEADIASGRYQGDVLKLALKTNPRAKMMNVEDGFVKIISRRGSGTVIGGVVVGPRASELIFPIAIAVTQKLHVDDLANTFTVYPSLTGSISEAARRLHVYL
ncbi:NAD(P)H-quinone dehydrogenase [Haematomicrobium sanguinis]|uniref:NAD(P)H-quinone dehydrogenase n=1 Tax=Haematomicrobium sanguinis TaxID=479106 RepID=UPI00047B0128